MTTIRDQVKEQLKLPPPPWRKVPAPGVEFYSQDIFPCKIVRDGIIGTDLRFATLVKVDGINLQIQSPLERYTAIGYLAALADQQESNFQWHYECRERSLNPMIEELSRLRLSERNPLLRDCYWDEINHLKKMKQKGGIVQRSNTLVLAEEKNAQVQMIGAAGSELEDDERKPGVLQRIGAEFVDAFGEVLRVERPEAVEARLRQNRAENIPPHVTALLGQRAGAAAGYLTQAGMQAQVLGQDEVMQLLAGISGGVATGGRDALAPPDYDEVADGMRWGGRYITVLSNAEWPSQVKPGWLLPLLRYRGARRLELSIHYNPIANEDAEKKLGNNERMLSWAADDDRSNRKLSRAQTHAASLRQLLAEQGGRVFMASLYIAVSGNTLREMRRARTQVYQIMSQMRLKPYVMRLDQLYAYHSVMPLGWNRVQERGDDRGNGLQKFMQRVIGKTLTETVERNVSSSVVASTVTPLIATIDIPGGQLVGLAADGGLVVIDPLKLDPNQKAGNEVFVATTGGGKTFSMLKELYQQLLKNQQLQGFFIDPQGGVMPFTRMVGGSYVSFSLSSGKVINVLDRRRSSGRLISLGFKLNYLRAIFGLMIGREIGNSILNMINRAIKAMYAHFEAASSTLPQISKAVCLTLGFPLEVQAQVADLVAAYCRGEITKAEVGSAFRLTLGVRTDEATLATSLRYVETERKPFDPALPPVQRCTPILEDIMPYLVAEGGGDLVSQLEVYIDPDAYGKGYNGHTNVPLDNRFVAFGVRDVLEDQRALVMYIIMEHIWQETVDNPKPRVTIVDEIGILLMENNAYFAKRITSWYKRMRALRNRIVAADQNLGTLAGNEMGKWILGNTAIYKLGRQARLGSNIAELAAQFNLTPSQLATLLSAKPGEVLIVTGSKVIHAQYDLGDDFLRKADTVVEGRAAEELRLLGELSEEE